MFKRVGLFLITNLAIIVVLSVLLRITGLDRAGYGSLGSILAYAAIIGFTGSGISLLMSKWSAKFSTGAVVIETPQGSTETWLFNTVSELASKAGIGTPEIAVFESDDPNAFATGAFRNSALVAVSSGLLQHMEKDEVKAVLAHEISHVANGDMVTLTLLQGVVNTFVIFASRVIGSIIDKAVFKSDGPGIGSFVITMLLQIVLGILASLVVLAFSRHREYRADAGAASLVGAGPMIGALVRLKEASEAGSESALPEKVAAFGIRGGSAFGRIFSSGMFSTHPPIELRIQALREIS